MSKKNEKDAKLHKKRLDAKVHIKLWKRRVSQLMKNAITVATNEWKKRHYKNTIELLSLELSNITTRKYIQK